MLRVRGKLSIESIGFVSNLAHSALVKVELIMNEIVSSYTSAVCILCHSEQTNIIWFTSNSNTGIKFENSFIHFHFSSDIIVVGVFVDQFK